MPPRKINDLAREAVAAGRLNVTTTKTPVAPIPEPILYSRAEAAKLLACSARLLEDMAARGEGPRVVPIGRRVGYRPQDLRLWAAERALPPSAYRDMREAEAEEREALRSSGGRGEEDMRPTRAARGRRPT